MTFIEIPIDFNGRKMCGDFYLYSEKEILKIKESINFCFN
jgi:hypothetical protein